MKLRILICLLIAVSLAGCSRGAKPGKAVAINEYFLMKKGEVVNIQGTEINVRMIDNGTGENQSGDEITFCDAEITYKGEVEEVQLQPGAFASYGEYNIRLEKANLAIDDSKKTCQYVVVRTLG